MFAVNCPDSCTALVDADLLWLGHGFSGFDGWEVVAYTLLTTHLTIVSVTVFLHRCQAHRALDLHPAASHFFRLWLWLGTGIETRQWVAVHRKHHARCETDDDPHSPQRRGIGEILLRGRELYCAAAREPATIEQFGRGTPQDWLETNVYSRHGMLGISLLLALDLFLFGAIGMTVWAVQMLWIPVMAAGIVNGIGHWWGYRNFEAADESRNFLPWGVLIGGKELHNNHHTYPTSAKLSIKPYEFDIGWAYIRLLELMRLARVNRRAPRLRFDAARVSVDATTLAAIVANRFELMARYAGRVRAAAVAELRDSGSDGADAARRAAIRRARPWLHRDGEKIPIRARAQVAQALSVSPRLKLLVDMREKLRRLWTSTNVTADELVADLQSWLHEAEQSGVAPLQEFASRLKSATA